MAMFKKNYIEGLHDKTPNDLQSRVGLNQFLPGDLLDQSLRCLIYTKKSFMQINYYLCKFRKTYFEKKNEIILK